MGSIRNLGAIANHSVGRPGASGPELQENVVVTGAVLHDDLSGVSFIGFNREADFVAGMRHLGVVFEAAQVVLASENHLFQWEMACRGLGVAVMMQCVGDAEPRVERAFPDLPPIPVPMWLVSHRAVRTSRRVRAVFDLMVAFFRERGAASQGEGTP